MVGMAHFAEQVIIRLKEILENEQVEHNQKHTPRESKS
jgi:hypothetical protein